MMTIKSTILFLFFVVGAFACRPATVQCGDKWSAAGYFGDAIQDGLSQIPDTDGFRFTIPTSGKLWQKCGQAVSSNRVVRSSIQVMSVCDGCNYEAYGNEIHCYVNQGLSQCGSSDDWHGQARVCNDYYCINLTACLE